MSSPLPDVNCPAIELVEYLCCCNLKQFIPNYDEYTNIRFAIHDGTKYYIHPKFTFEVNGEILFLYALHSGAIDQKLPDALQIYSHRIQMVPVLPIPFTTKPLQQSSIRYKRLPNIAFCGLKGAGKTTSTIYAIEQSNWSYQEVSFGKVIKDICSYLHDIPVREFQDVSLKDKAIDSLGVTRRTLLLAMGDALRKYIPEQLPNLQIKYSLITDKVQREIKQHKSQSKPMIVSDVRMPGNDETKMLKDEQFWLINIERPELKTNDVSRHWTEQGITNADFTIINNGTIQDLYNKINAVLKTIEDLEQETMNTHHKLFTTAHLDV